jgi:hypothetical protein
MSSGRPRDRFLNLEHADVSLVVMPISMAYSPGLVDALLITAMAQPVCQTGAASAVAA